MAREHVEVVRALYAYAGSAENLVESLDDPAYVTAGESAFAHLAHPEFEFVLVQGEGGEQGTFRGVPGFFRGMREWLAGWATYRIDVEGFLDLGDRVLVLTVDRGRSKAGGVPLTQRAAVLYEFRDDAILRVETYMDRCAALAAAGVGEQALSAAERP